MSVTRALALCLIATPAAAQVTNCQLYPTSVSCQTTQRPGVEWTIGQQPGVEIDASVINQAVEARRRARADEQARADAALVNARAQAAGRLIAQGKCADARALALNAGDLALAQQVANACK